MQEEMEARGLSPDEVANGLGLTTPALDEIFCGERAISPKIASAAESFLGISTSLWLNMEASYRLTLANNFEVYGHANPFDGPESEWLDACLDLPEQEGSAAAISPGS